MENNIKDLIIMGAGDLGKDVAWLVERINEYSSKWNLLGFTDKCDIDNFQGYPVLGEDEVISNYDEVYVVCAITNLDIKENILNNLPKNAKIATLIDPSALIHKTAIIEEGAIVFANTVIGVNAHVGKQTIILYNSAVNHDVVVEDYTIIYPNATISGKCHVGRNCEIGTGASLIQGINICDNAKIGVGAAVFTNIDKSGTTIGNPAVTMGNKKKE